MPARKGQPPPGPHRYPEPITDEEFAAIYNASNSLLSAARALGWSKYDTLTRANAMRARGARLTHHPNRQLGPQAQRFIAIWQSANSLAEAAEAFGMSPNVASSTATRLRARGVPLKKF